MELNALVKELHAACQQGDVTVIGDVLRSLSADELSIAEQGEPDTALHIASRHGHLEIVRMLLDYGDLMTKKNKKGVTAFRSAKDDQIKQVFILHQQPLPRFSGNILEWNIVYRDPATKRAQIRQHLSRNHFINQNFITAARCYVRYYLPLEGFPRDKINQLETMAYTSPDEFLRAYTSSARLYEMVNRHLATYAMAYFDSTIDISIPYSPIHYLLSIIALVIDAYKHRRSYQGCVHRGMLIRREDLDKYVVGSRIFSTTFLSTSTNREVAEIFAGFHSCETSTTAASPQIRAVCSYNIRNEATAFDIKQLSNFREENEVLIFPFAAFRIADMKKASSTHVIIQLEECDDSSMTKVCTIL